MVIQTFRHNLQEGGMMVVAASLLTEELMTLLLVTWVALAGIVNGQPHQGQGNQGQ